MSKRKPRGKETLPKPQVLKPVSAPIHWWIVDEGYSGTTNKGELTGIRAGVTVVKQPGKQELAQELATLGTKPDAEREPEFAKLIADLAVSKEE